ncbi:hypothetical protein CCUG62472_00705 [Mycobacteroides salmoniphilum]|nr:hypothetical protein CCUG62472_00705 [Mycobacteroides salmoniphilum]
MSHQPSEPLDRWPDIGHLLGVMGAKGLRAQFTGPNLVPLSTQALGGRPHTPANFSTPSESMYVISAVGAAGYRVLKVVSGFAERLQMDVGFLV